MRAAESAAPRDALFAHLVAPKNFSIAFKLYDLGVTFSEETRLKKNVEWIQFNSCGCLKFDWKQEVLNSVV